MKAWEACLQSRTREVLHPCLGPLEVAWLAPGFTKSRKFKLPFLLFLTLDCFFAPGCAIPAILLIVSCWFSLNEGKQNCNLQEMANSSHDLGFEALISKASKVKCCKCLGGCGEQGGTRAGFNPHPCLYWPLRYLRELVGFLHSQRAESSLLGKAMGMPVGELPVSGRSPGNKSCLRSLWEQVH